MLTGEPGSADLKRLERAQIVVSSPGAWDALSRRWRQRKAVQAVSLFIVDEAHLLGGGAGPTLEVICSRMRYIAAQMEKPIRIVALSSSLANAKDVGEWLGVRSQALFNFHPNVRPVPLECHIQGFDANHYGTRMLGMAKPCYNALVRYSGGLESAKGEAEKPSLVFVPSRKQSQLTAIDMVTFAAAAKRPFRFCKAGDGGQEEAARAAAAVQDPALQHTLQFGVAFAHEGLRASDRAAAVKVRHPTCIILFFLIYLVFSVARCVPNLAEM